jgi:hypothetical protein
MAQIPISIQALRPIWASDAGKVVNDGLAEQVSSYSQDVQAVGGYGSASFQFPCNQQTAEEWIDGGIGLHIEVYDGINQVWEGFVNEVSANLGALSVKRGPLLNITNRTKVTYQTTSYATNPPIGGQATETAWDSDLDSISAYGQLEGVLTGGQGTAANAEKLRDVYLLENKYAETNNSLSIQGGEGQVSVSVSCVGYHRLLERYFYSNSASGTVTADARIEAVLTADPSSRFSSDYGEVDGNSVTVPAYEKGDRTAWTVIKSALALGGSSDERWLFGIYNGRKARYEAMPSDIAYLFRLGDTSQVVEDALLGSQVARWDVTAGKWLMFPDFLAGRGSTSTLRDDPRNLFIESASYQAPWFLTLGGAKVGKLAQLLAKQGLGSI